MGHKLHHDCLSWDELYEDDDGELVNTWNGPTSSDAPMLSKRAKIMASSSPAIVLSDVANALIPGAEVVLRMNPKAKRAALSRNKIQESFVECYTLEITENSILRFNVAQNIARL